MREQVTHQLAALAIRLELELRTDDAALVLVSPSAERLHGDRLAIERIEFRLLIKRIDVAGPAVAEDENDALGLSRVHRLFRRERVDKLLGGTGATKEPVGTQQARQGDRSESAANFPEEFTAG